MRKTFSLPVAATAAGGGVTPPPAYTIDNSVRFNPADSAYMRRTPSSAGNQKTWTWSGWVKRSGLGEQHIFETRQASNNTNATVTKIAITSTDQLEIAGRNLEWYLTSGGVYRDVSAWYHIVVAIDTTNSTGDERVKAWVNGEEVTGTRVNPTLDKLTAINSTQLHAISGRAHNNDRFIDGYLADIHFIDGQALTPSSFGFTDSNGVWQPKAYTGSYGTNGFHLDFADTSSATALGNDVSGNNNDWTVNNLDANVTDYLSDTTGTPFSTITYPLANLFDGSTTTATTPASGTSIIFEPSLPISVSSSIRLYGFQSSTNEFFKINDTVVTNVPNAAGWFTPDIGSSITALSKFEFYTTSGQYAALVYAIEIDGTILISGDPADTDSLVDSPTNGTASSGGDAGGTVVGNYCTFNPLAKHPSVVLTNGNLDAVSVGVYTALTTIGFPSTGKYYAEFKIYSTVAGYPFVGIGGFNDVGLSAYSNPNTGAFYAQGGYITGSVSVTSLPALSAGDIVGVAYDAATREVWFSLNGTYVSSGNPATGANPLATLGANASGLAYGSSTYASASTSPQVSFNAGQRPFKYPAPAGYKSLCSTNLPTPAIADGSTAMDVVTWTGDGSAPRTFGGLNFSPDFVWVKSRSNSGWWHQLFDVIRGGGGLFSNSNNAELAQASNVAGYVSAYNSDGFTATAGSLGLGSFNATNDTYVAWTWDAGSSTVSNTDGSITSQVRANPSAGFSIVTYTGTASDATVGHGLGITPELLFVKNRTTSFDWAVYHSALGGTKYLDLNTTDQAVAADGRWNNTDPTTTVFSVGNSTATGKAPNDYVAYCFAPVEGFSSFGSYTGNASSDGPFVYTGFRPRWILIKSSSNTETWNIYDTTRDTDNVLSTYLQAQSSAAEGTNHAFDILSNGFKLRWPSAGAGNTSGATYIYAAFAEHPFKTSRAR